MVVWNNYGNEINKWKHWLEEGNNGIGTLKNYYYDKVVLIYIHFKNLFPI